MSTISYSIARLYLKSASIEVPDMASLPRLAVQPDIGVDFQTDVKPAWAGHVECVLTISLHGRLNGKTMFMIEVAQAGVFKLPPGTAQDIVRFAKETAAQVLFPYARKHLAAMAVSAGFQPVILDHTDFGALLNKLANQPKPARQPAAESRAASPATIPTPPARQAQPAATQSPAAAKPQGLPAAPAARAASAPSAPRPEPTPTQNAAPPRSTTPSVPRTPRHASPLVAASIIIFFAAACAIWLWPRGPEPAAAPAPLAASVPAKLAAEREKRQLLERGERIIAASHARLADQADTAYTLELGTLASADAVPALESLQTQRALFVDRRADGSLAVLYGIFPDAALARAAVSELALQFPPALTLRKQVVRLRGDEHQSSDPALAGQPGPEAAQIKR